MMPTEGASDGGWFQPVVTIVLTVLGLVSGWAQFQINALRRDNELTENRATAAVDALRTEINKRDETERHIQGQQHEDNRAEQAATRSAIKAISDESNIEHRLMRSALEKMNERISELATAVAGLKR